MTTQARPPADVIPRVPDLQAGAACPPGSIYALRVLGTRCAPGIGRLSQAARRANERAWLARPSPATAATPMTAMITCWVLRLSCARCASTASPIAATTTWRWLLAPG